MNWQFISVHFTLDSRMLRAF